MYSEKLLRSHPTGVFVVIHTVILTVSTVFQCVHFSEKTQLVRPKPGSLHKTDTSCDSLMYLFVCVHSVGEQVGCVVAMGRLTEEQVAQVFAAAEISRAYRRTQHEKLLEFIIKDHGADDHLLAVVSRKALIKVIQTVERISLPEAENLFMDGPAYSECEREEFDILVVQQLEAQGKHH
ncbi:uncharacterized protein LOC120542665 isoform X2 [Polypterus senegalus]|uniref:uncharacterized protein LOC120542665 isoform X2 n=1 Tax=Polypterus senegalus TaxID=55291 RepID=UPI0019636EAE|nr:uncharacterized protein LOC120542665 isoform X2 [Polypterus senegalus]